MRSAATCVAVLLAGWPAAAQIDVDNRPLKVDPSGPASPAYRDSIEERNRKAREEAERSGKSHVDTTFGEMGDPEAGAGALPPLPGTAPQAGPERRPERSAGPTALPPPARRQREPDYEGFDEVGQGELRQLIGELLQALDRQPEVVRLRAASRREAREPARREETPPAPLPAGGFPKVTAGSGLYARVLYAVNSDYRGPVLIEVLEPPLAGAVLSGGFERVRDRLVLRLGRLSWRGREAAVEAWAVGLDCACYGVGGEVDRHWFERLILPAAFRFAEGYLSARGSGGRRVEVSGETVVDESGRPTGDQAIYSGLGNAARTFGDILLEDAPRGPTVRIPRDTEIAVVFARPPGETAPTTRAAAPAPRGPTTDGVIRVVARPGPAEEAEDGRGDAPARGRGE